MCSRKDLKYKTQNKLSFLRLCEDVATIHYMTTKKLSYQWQNKNLIFLLFFFPFLRTVLSNTCSHSVSTSEGTLCRYNCLCRNLTWSTCILESDFIAFHTLKWIRIDWSIDTVWTRWIIFQIKHHKLEWIISVIYEKICDSKISA